MRSAALSETERRDWLRLSMSENVGPQGFRLLIGRYGSAAAALEALPQLARRGGLRRPPRLYAREAAERDLAMAAALGARFVASCEPDYPALLRAIDPPPPLLCIKGDASLLNRSAVGIVGARNASAAGRKLARQLAVDIGSAGHAIVSGLARGIDTAAHEASLESGTIAVLAGGIDVIYPPENDALQRAIGERGVLVTEMVPGTLPRAEHFPRRNRIISGIARSVVIVEAALRSGSLITARYANEQGREVFAVPGSPLDPRCEGCNRLIRDGATLLLSAADVLDRLNESWRPIQSALLEPEPEALVHHEPQESDREIVLSLLSPTPIGMDDLIRESGLPGGMVAALLLELGLAGRVLRHGNGAVSLA